MIQQLGKNGGLIQPLINFCSAYDAYGQGVKKTDPLRLSRFDILQDVMDAFWSKVRNIQIRSMKPDHVAKEDMDAALEHMSARTHPDILQAFRSERQKIIDDLEK
jgi:small-conductance mechanosensitive channel